ncbi:MAG TPA: DUF72 domain-containing protein [Flavisolibacter sp.]
MRSRIHIGTSGWSYKHWKGLYYPLKLAASKWLSFYARDFEATEINSSFYRLPTEEAVVNWTKQVPGDFLFCPKMSRFLTHMKKLNDPQESLERFFEVFIHMKKMMGPVLVQLPPMLAFNRDKTVAFYKLLRSQYNEYSFVMEVRHHSWMSEESLELMKNYDIGFVISQSGTGFPYGELVTSKNIYVRFHGPGALYASPYPDKMLEYFANKFYGWLKKGHEIWAFFNNDLHGYAPDDAKKLMMLMEK